ncbi:MAG: hypothetical protein RQ761_06990 [Bacteroidales bacterium]|nr:hypothetical protein [Bacteroidales bacterium]
MKKILLALLVHVILTASCQAQLTTILKDARFFKGPLKKVALITQISDTNFRKDVELAIGAAFERKHIPYVNAYDIILPDTLIFYSTLEREFYDAGADGVLIVKLVDVELTDMYIIPGGVLPPDAYNYYEFYSVYYYFDLPVVGAPGYLQRDDRKFRLDANLYQGKGDMIIWSGQSKPIKPADYSKTVRSFARKLAKILLSEGLVLKK